MNALVIGSHKEPILRFLPNDSFLLIDDGPIADQVLASQRTVRQFEPFKDSFNPLKDMSYRRARDFLTVLDATFPEGESTLTKRYSNFIILKALLARPTKLSGLIPLKKDTADAHQKIETLLLSPVLERVLERPANFSVDGTIVARLDRAQLGDFDCFVLANLLVSLYSGTVVLPDFGFYACAFHSSLIRQERLIAGINSFDEVPRFRSQLLTLERKVGSRCTPDDAEVLALYAGKPRGTNDYNDFIASCIRPA